MNWALKGVVAICLGAHVGASSVVVLPRPFFPHGEATQRLAEL